MSGLFAICGEQGLFSGCSTGLLIMMASVIAEHGLYAPEVVAHGLNCSVACGIFLDQG